MTKNYRIKGMTCEHCSNAVTEEVSEIDGVTDVTVELDSGIARVSGHDFTDAQVAAAVEEAGYEVLEED